MVIAYIAIKIYYIFYRHNDFEVLRKINELDKKLQSMEKEKRMADRVTDLSRDNCQGLR